MTVELKVPDIGDFADVEIIEVLIAIGDSVNIDDEVLTLESDKASMGIPSSIAGVVTELKVALGDKVSSGDVIALLEGAKSEEPTAAVVVAPKPEIEKEEIVAEASVIPYAPDTIVGKKKAHASPAVRKYAYQLGVNLNEVSGTGQKARVVKTDVDSFVKARINQPAAVSGGLIAPKIAPVDFSLFGDTTTQELSRINRIAGKHLYSCWLNIPHVTQFADADITEMEKFRQQNKKDAANMGVNLTPLVFIMKAVVAALKAYPKFNSSLDESEENLIIKKYYNIGVAVDTPNGLVVPVVRDVDKKGFIDLAGELGEISPRARDGGLSSSELRGGTFTISSLGGIGGNYFTPIVNAPEVAILGVGRHEMRPVWNGKKFKPHLMLPLSLSYNHKVIDGADGARFITHIGRILSDIRKVLL